MTEYLITDLQPALEQMTPGVDEPWLITATLLDDQGEPLIAPVRAPSGRPVYDGETGEQLQAPVTLSGSWWTSGGWNYFPPQAYDASGNRHESWEDPPGTSTSLPRTATFVEIEPQLREFVMDAVVVQWEVDQPQP